MWIQKQGYSTFLLADETDLNSRGTEIQRVKFQEGKYSHYHKKKTEYFYIIKGRGKVVLDGKEITIEAEASILVKPNMVHTFISDPSDPLEMINLKTNSLPEDTFTDK